MLDISKACATFKRDVNVRFAQPNGAYHQGVFEAEFRRIDQDRVDDMLDDELRQSEVLDEVLVGVGKIGRDGQEMPAEEALAWARSSPECVSAMVTAFFDAMAPDRSKRTSKRPRKRG